MTEAFTQTLTNKTLSGASNTFTNITATASVLVSTQNKVLGRFTSGAGLTEELEVRNGLELNGLNLQIGGTMVSSAFVELNGNAIQFYNTIGSVYGFGLQSGISGLNIVMEHTGNTFSVESTGAIYTDALGKGIQYSGTGSVTQLHSLADKEYSDSHFIGKALPSAPSSGQNGQSVRWNNGGNVWEYYTTVSAPNGSDLSRASATVTVDNGTTALTITRTPTGIIFITIDEAMVALGDASKTKDCYFSSNGGTTAKALSAITAGDTLYWNAVITGVNLSSANLISMYYL